MVKRMDDRKIESDLLTTSMTWTTQSAVINISMLLQLIYEKKKKRNGFEQNSVILLELILVPLRVVHSFNIKSDSISIIR